MLQLDSLGIHQKFLSLSPWFWPGLGHRGTAECSIRKLPPTAAVKKEYQAGLEVSVLHLGSQVSCTPNICKPWKSQIRLEKEHNEDQHLLSGVDRCCPKGSQPMDWLRPWISLADDFNSPWSVCGCLSACHEVHQGGTRSFHPLGQSISCSCRTASLGREKRIWEDRKASS